HTDYINDVELLNAPNTTALRRGLGMPLLMVVGGGFSVVGKKPSLPQLYQISGLGKAQGGPTRPPAFLPPTGGPGPPPIEGAELDFRDEIMAQIYDRGDARPKRTLTFNIQVTDDGETHGPFFRERRTLRNWRRIGTITFDQAVVSYNGDFVIHFHHPTWR